MSTETKTRMCWIAICKCGCGSHVGAYVDDPEYKDSIAKFIGECVMDGETVARIPADDVRVRRCKVKS
jgi:hypothetical protein